MKNDTNNHNAMARYMCTAGGIAYRYRVRKCHECSGDIGKISMKQNLTKYDIFNFYVFIPMLVFILIFFNIILFTEWDFYGIFKVNSRTHIIEKLLLTFVILTFISLMLLF